MTEPRPTERGDETFLAHLEQRRAALDGAMWQAPALTIAAQAFLLAVLTDREISLHTDSPTLVGRPVAVSADMPATGANARSVVFGDLNAAYTVRRVSGLGLQRIDEVYSLNGQVGFRLAWRVDGRPVDLAAAIVLRNAAS